jgi:hypothetical protein
MSALGKITRKYALGSGAEVAYAGTWWITADDAAALAVAYESAIPDYWTAVADFYADSLSWVETIYQAVDVATGTVLFTASEPGPGAGTNSNVECPPQCSVVVSIKTALAGRSYRGRMYLPAPTAASLTQVGRLDPDFVSALLAAEAGLTTAVQSGAAGNIGVYSRKLHTFQEANALSIGDVMDTQRSRRDALVETRVSATV